MVLKITELVGVSEKNFEDAVQQAVTHASKTVRNIKGVDVLGFKAAVDGTQIKEYRANVKISFVVES